MDFIIDLSNTASFWFLNSLLVIRCNFALHPLFYDIRVTQEAANLRLDIGLGGLIFIPIFGERLLALLLFPVSLFPLVVCHTKLSEVSIQKVALFGGLHEFFDLALESPDFIFIFEKLCSYFDVLSVVENVLINVDTSFLQEASEIDLLLLACALLLQVSILGCDKIVVYFWDLFSIFYHVFENLRTSIAVVSFTSNKRGIEFSFLKLPRSNC